MFLTQICLIAWVRIINSSITQKVTVPSTVPPVLTIAMAITYPGPELFPSPYSKPSALVSTIQPWQLVYAMPVC